MKAFNWKKPAMLVLAAVLAGQGAWEYNYRPGSFHPRRIVASDLSVADQVMEIASKVGDFELKVAEASKIIKKDDVDIKEYLIFKSDLLKLKEQLDALYLSHEKVKEENPTLSEDEKKLIEDLQAKLFEAQKKLVALSEEDEKSHLALKSQIKEREERSKEIESLKETICEQRLQLDNLVEKMEHLIEKQEKVISYVDPMGMMNMAMPFSSPFGFGMPNMFSMGFGMNSPMMTMNLFNMFGMQMQMHNLMAGPSINYRPQFHNYFGQQQGQNYRAPSIEQNEQFSLLYPEKPELSVPFISPGMRSPIQADFIQLDSKAIQKVETNKLAPIEIVRT
ncbi:MAG: hypothetical protein Fur0010_09850 [Bdellovibrio sp.]